MIHSKQHSLLILLLALAGLIFLSSCSQKKDESASPSPPDSVFIYNAARARAAMDHGMATLDGRDESGKVVAPVINLWKQLENPWGGGLAGTAPHGARVKVITVAPNGCKVKYGSVEGWVANSLIKRD